MVVVESLPKEYTPEYALERLWDLPYCCALESALRLPRLGRYSFVTADPFEVFRVHRAKGDALGPLANALSRYSTESIPGLPPFQGGAAGVFTYDLGRCFERIPSALHNEFDLPLAVLGVYDVVLAWDHVEDRAWLISQGFPEIDESNRKNRAEQRARFFLERLKMSAVARPAESTSVHATAHGLTAPQFSTRLGSAWLGNFDSHGYRDAVNRAREYIFAGDIFQVNLSQRLMRRATCDSLDLYLSLRQANAAPFAGYFNLGTAQVVCSSPERFLQVHDRRVETRPIKGTRKQTGDPVIDRSLSQEMQRSPKDRAENVMIVDLLRNDLSRVCQPESVCVPQLCEVEAFPGVLHLVSAVEGQLATDAGLTDLIAATFPGGSITGAPKVRAMEIISELEPTVRGAYCGSMGYLSFDGSMDLNILIRTITASRGWWQFQVGGGIVADSVAEAEEEETWTKAAGMVAAIARAVG